MILNAARRAGTSAVLSYRALFTWLNPYGYVSSRVVMPVAIAVIFASVSQVSHGDATRPVVGGALIAIAISSFFGMALAVGNERTFGTLGLWIAAPEGLLSSLFGKVLIHVIDGMLGAILTFTVNAALFDVSVTADDVPKLLAVALCVTVSAGGMALVVGAAVFLWRDTFTPPTIATQAVLLCSGAMVALGALPAVIEDLATVVPVSHATTAALHVLRQGDLDQAALGWELLVGAGWGLLGYLGLSLGLYRLRRSGGVDFA